MKESLFGFSFSLICFAVFVFIGCNQPVDSGNVNNDIYNLNIGDTGPAGGIVFYIDIENDFDWTYLEVAPKSTEMTAAWDPARTAVGGAAMSKAIGGGYAATQAIIAVIPTDGIAARLCAELEHEHDGTTFKDWFLPSRGELSILRTNLIDITAPGEFQANWYWSSSDETVPSTNFANAVNFATGAMGPENKANSRPVRAIRSF